VGADDSCVQRCDVQGIAFAQVCGSMSKVPATAIELIINFKFRLLIHRCASDN
jgi:hypothetical protein